MSKKSLSFACSPVRQPKLRSRSITSFQIVGGKEEASSTQATPPGILGGALVHTIHSVIELDPGARQPEIHQL